MIVYLNGELRQVPAVLREHPAGFPCWVPAELPPPPFGQEWLEVTALGDPASFISVVPPSAVVWMEK